MLEIIWSQRTQKEFNNTILYWAERNKSDTFSKKLIKEVDRKQDYLSKNPNSGTPLNYELVYKIQILNFYSLIYELENNRIKIISFWDNRRNPENIDII